MPEHGGIRLQNQNGVGGRRYYTRGQIEAIVQIAGDLGTRRARG